MKAGRVNILMAVFVATFGVAALWASDVVGLLLETHILSREFMDNSTATSRLTLIGQLNADIETATFVVKKLSEVLWWLGVACVSLGGGWVGLYLLVSVFARR